MEDILKGKDKIQKICNLIKEETLQPAKQQAIEILENANLEAEKIIRLANKEKEKLISEAKKDIEKEKKVFDSSMNLASKQAIEELKQKIENELFNKNLHQEIIKSSCDPKIIANIINVIIHALKEEGIDVDVSAYITKNVDPKAVNSHLLKEVIERLEEKEIVISDFNGGVMIKLHDMQITLDISDEALKELMASFLRKDFSKRLFS